VVRRQWPAAFPALDRALFEAHFVTGADIGDRAVLADAVERAGAPPSEVKAAVAATGHALVDESIASARDHGIAATPAWLFGDAFVVPGVQPRELFERVVTRLRTRTGTTPAGPGP
jgi:predicted DsbA family dithiol-disulfide isomerase